MRAVFLCAGVLASLCAGPDRGGSAAPVGDAVALYRQGRYGEARNALQGVVASDPSNAAACYFLALTLQRVAPPSLDSARTWLAKAVRLAPANEAYLAEYAGVCLLLADRDTSLGLALEGRDAMARAVAMNPADLDARDALMRFFARAPWPLGGPDRALEQAAEIAKRDARRGYNAFRAIAAIFVGQGRKAQALAANRAAERLAQPGAR